MRFLFIGQGYPGAGGTSDGSGIGTYLREMAVGLRALGHECHVLVWLTEPAERVALLPLSHRHFSSVPPSEQCVQGVRVFALRHAYWPVVERFVPDSSDAHRLRQAVRYLCDKYEYDWIEIQSEEGIASGVMKEYPSKSILRIHTTLTDMVRDKQVTRSYKVRRRLAREDKSFRRARRVVTHSEFHAEQLVSRFPFLSGLAVVRHGCDIEEQTGETIKESTVPTFMVVGTADRRKGFDRIMPVLREYQSRFGPCGARIVSSCSDTLKREFGLLPPFSRGISIEWCDALSRDDLFRQYRQASVLLHLARYESFGWPLVEAAAVGTPVISTPVGVAPELLRQELAPYLINGENPAECAEAIHKALVDGTMIRPIFQARYRGAFTREKMVAAYLALLDGWSKAQC